MDNREWLDDKIRGTRTRLLEAKSRLYSWRDRQKHRLRLMWTPERREMVEGVAQWLGFVVVNGLPVNYVFHVFTSVPLTPRHVVAFGIIAYLVKTELPRIVASLRGPRVNR